MTNVRQRIFDSISGSTLLASPAQVLYETDDSHDHWHLKNIARYSLWNLEGTAEVAPAQKVGFCLIDSTRRETTGPVSPQYTEDGNDFCAQDNPAASSLTMGISAGWRDVYHRSLAFQWIDVSDVAPGSYRLRAEIDPEGRIRESNEVNPPAFGAGAAVVPGYRATNVGVATAKGPRQVQLAAANVGGLTQAPQFKIVTAPKHGSLDRPVGQWFSGGSVRYTPATPYSRADSFTFAARNPGSSFPRNPPAAVATLEGLGALVTVSGAPRRLRAGDAARLKAVVRNDSPKVSWSVGGVTGGSKIRGRISAKGLYRAPKRVPPGGRVRVSATSCFGRVRSRRDQDSQGSGLAGGSGRARRRAGPAPRQQSAFAAGLRPPREAAARDPALGQGRRGGGRRTQEGHRSRPLPDARGRAAAHDLRDRARRARGARGLRVPDTADEQAATTQSTSLGHALHQGQEARRPSRLGQELTPPPPAACSFRPGRLAALQQPFGLAACRGRRL